MSIELEVRVQVVRACSVPINGGVHDNAYSEAWFLGFLIFLFVSYRLMLYRGTKLCVRRRDQDCSEMSEYRVRILSAEPRTVFVFCAFVMCVLKSAEPREEFLAQRVEVNLLLQKIKDRPSTDIHVRIL